MKKTLVLFIGLLFTSIVFSQDNENTKQYEYLTINVIYGLKTSGFVNKIFVDIGKTGGHSLRGKVTNKNNKVQIDNYLYDSAIDLINYLGKQGWHVIHYNEIKILNETYYSYTMEKIK